MNRQKFIGAAAVSLTGVALVATEAKAEKKGKAEHGACGLSCKACRMQLNGKCPGCGEGMKANCPILKCAQMKKLDYCAQCKGYPCAKIKDSGKFGEPWMKKIGGAPLPS